MTAARTPEERLGDMLMEDYEAEPEAPPENETMYGRLRVLTLAHAMNAPPRRYLLHGLIAPGEMSVWFGAPKCGKSFLALRLAYGLATGRGMWEREARASRVLYVAAEGEGGINARLIALRDALGDAGDAFHYIAQPVTIGPPGFDLDHIIQAAKDLRVDVIVLDTLARTFGIGDENSTKDMGAFIAACDRIRHETQAHVAVIHHGTKAGEHMRGSGALLGAADLAVRVAKNASGIGNTAMVEAAKDDADGATLAFRLRVVEVRTGTEEAARETCIAEEAEAGDARGGSRLSQAQRRALDLLHEAMHEASELVPPGVSAPPGTRGVREDTWRERVYAGTVSSGTTQDTRRKAFKRAAEALLAARCIGLHHGWVWPV
ncbi:MAG: AAA family ATPase [Rhodospirillales bacterium]|nr:AAA family ATPase [Rhodospirillales bacterium]